jgi:hypothetical protein
LIVIIISIFTRHVFQRTDPLIDAQTRK